MYADFLLLLAKKDYRNKQALRCKTKETQGVCKVAGLRMIRPSSSASLPT